MNLKIRKRIMLLMAASIAVSMIIGCGRQTEVSDGNSQTGIQPEGEREEAISSDQSADQDTFYIYASNKTFEERLQYVYKKYPDMKKRIKLVCIEEPEKYRKKLEQLLQTPEAEDYPDMVVLDADTIREDACGDNLLSIADCGLTDEDSAQMYPYTLELATDQKTGDVMGLSWQICPGAFVYRADLAETYLGVFSPEEMQERVATWDSFLQTAQEIKNASEDGTRILSSCQDITEVFAVNKSLPWVDDTDVFSIDDTMLTYMEVYKILYTEELTQNSEKGSEEWKVGAYKDTVFGYFGGANFLQYVLKLYCGGETVGEGTYGLWNICQGPGAYYDGGSWLCATTGCEDPEFAGSIMKALCCDTEILSDIAEGTGALVNHKAVMQSLSDEGKGSYDLLGGQSYYALLMSLAERINVSTVTSYDTRIKELLLLQTQAYAQGEKNQEETITDFKASVSEAFPSLQVE